MINIMIFTVIHVYSHDAGKQSSMIVFLFSTGEKVF